MTYILIALLWGGLFLIYPWYEAIAMIAVILFVTDYFCLRFRGFGMEVFWK